MRERAARSSPPVREGGEMKVVGLVSQCDECPNKSYYSGGSYNCSKANALLPWEPGRALVPEWCPLPDYPAAAMSRITDENSALKREVADLTAQLELSRSARP